MRRQLSFVAVGMLILSCSESASPNYHHDVAPILARNCLRCHGDDAIHGPPLTTYAEVAARAKLIQRLVSSGQMPPGRIDRSGSCQEFEGPPRPTKAEIAVLTAWAETGAAEGSRSDRIHSDPTQTLTQNEPPRTATTTTLGLAEPYTPRASKAEPRDDHRCFLIDASNLPASIMTAFEVQPTAPALVHHLMLFTLGSDEDTRAAKLLDAQSTEPGWPCFGAPGVSGARLAGVWTPGERRQSFPPGTGVRLPVRRALVVQIHYQVPQQVSLAGAQTAAQSDQTRLQLSLVDHVDRELGFIPFANSNFILPPGQVVTNRNSAAFTADPAAEVVGVFPHMHRLGAALQLTAVNDRITDREHCLVNVPRWNYTWQEVAFYRTPLRLGPAPTLTLQCTWDTHGRSQSTVWGERADDEMCMVFLITAVANPR